MTSLSTNMMTFGPEFKGFPHNAPRGTAQELAERGWNIFADDLAFPIAVLKRSALEHNIAWMQDYVQRKGVFLAPHGKTTMSPELFAAQMVGGAWGLTFATAFQSSVGVGAGARRIIIANQVVCDADLDTLDSLLTQTDGLRVWFLVDTLAQLTQIEDWKKRRNSSRAFDVLLEIGIAGKRTGCRTLQEALDLAEAMARSGAVRLCGVEVYEGSVASCDNAHDSKEVTAVVRRVIEAARELDERDLWASDEDHILLTAGGSAVFDLVISLLRTHGLSRPVRGVLRSGCYIAHDHLNYHRFLRNVEQREGLDHSLRAALSVWAMVQSVPEPGLALLGCGRRDISYDLELPVALNIARRGERNVSAVPASWRITALNDHHAYLQFDPAELPRDARPQVGDRVELGISHPCTTFDKWRWVPLIEDDGAICGAIHTCF